MPLEYHADEQEEPPAAAGLTADEQAILDLFRAPGLDRAEGLRRLATRAEPMGRIAPGPGRPPSSR
jgi:hypothetical protein